MVFTKNFYKDELDTLKEEIKKLNNTIKNNDTNFKEEKKALEKKELEQQLESKFKEELKDKLETAKAKNELEKLRYATLEEKYNSLIRQEESNKIDEN